MDKNSKKSLKQLFVNYLEDPCCVGAEKFYENMEILNRTLGWDKKEIDWEYFQKDFDNYEPDKLELYIEGYRCLAQIHINLLKDFEIFKIYPIRKYSSAFNYISKVDNYEEMITKIGYELKDEENKYKLAENLKDIHDKENAIDTALKLLICYMELSEMIKIRYDMCEIRDLIIQRERNIAKNLEEIELKEMTDEDKLKKFEKCEICDNKMNLEVGECEVCQYSIAEFSFAHKYKQFIEKKFNVIVQARKIAQEKSETDNDIPQVKTFDNQKKSLEKVRENVREVPSEKWSCTQCTFLNEASSLNCTICENRRHN